MDRRGFLIAVAAFVAGACGRGAAATQRGRAIPPAPTLDVFQGGAPRYIEGVRAWVVPVPAQVRARATALLPEDMQMSVQAGFIALSDVCPSDKIQLRFCQTAGWYECPACGSRFNGLGDAMGGPAPSGLTMLTVTRDADEVFVNPRPRVVGLARGQILVDHAPTGPHCA